VSDVQRKEGKPGESQWRDCPGCPQCSPHDGLILRKGSWRHTTAFEYVFMFTKTADYACDKMGAVEQEVKGAAGSRFDTGKTAGHQPDRAQKGYRDASGRNPRTVWNLRRNDGHWLYCGSCGRFYESKSGLQKRDGKLVCVCGKTDGWVAHFATFPSSLVERCLRPIPRQVCGKCGMPWARVVEKGERRVTEAMKVAGCNSEGEYHGDNRADYTGSGAQPASDTKKRVLDAMAHGKTTLGFRPTCGCEEQVRYTDGSYSREVQPVPSVPATVLDPFNGTATTGVVALRMGFNYIGCELSPAYAKLSEARLAAATRQSTLDL